MCVEQNGGLARRRLLTIIVFIHLLFSSLLTYFLFS